MKRPTGFRAFSVIWLGQIVSAIGTRMTAFALGLWIWEHTGRVLEFALLEFCSFGATVVCSPLAGALVDRWNRRLTIILSDVGSLVATGGLLILFTTSVSTWELYVVSALTGAFMAFQYPAYSATITLMLERDHHPRANAMMALVRDAPFVAAPAFAAALLALVGIKPILAIDTVSYALAIGTVFLVAIPRTPKKTDAAPAAMWRDSIYGFGHIARRPPLLALLSVSFLISLIAAITWTVMVPMILADTGNSAGQAGLVQSIGAVGGVLGGVYVGASGRRREKIRFVLAAIVVMGVFRVVYGLSDSLVLWSLSLVVGWATIPVIDGYSQAIWQEKVAPEIQGRVFAAQIFVENLSLPIALAVSGVLADQIFLPAMRPNGALTPYFEHLVGTGRGAGMAVMCIFGGVLAVILGLAGYGIPLVRKVETLMPDNDEKTVEAPTGA